MTSLEKDTVILEKLVPSPALGTTTPAQIQLSCINTPQKACTTVASEVVKPIGQHAVVGSGHGDIGVGTSSPITVVTRMVQPSISGGTTLVNRTTKRLPEQLRVHDIVTI